jgi:hypothetical protein
LHLDNLHVSSLTALPVKPQDPPAITEQPPAAAGVQPVGNQAARKPLAAISQPEEDEDFGFDLDLNPGQSYHIP